MPAILYRCTNALGSNLKISDINPRRSKVDILDATVDPSRAAFVFTVSIVLPFVDLTVIRFLLISIVPCSLRIKR